MCVLVWVYFLCECVWEGGGREDEGTVCFHLLAVLSDSFMHSHSVLMINNI